MFAVSGFFCELKLISIQPLRDQKQHNTTTKKKKMTQELTEKKGNNQRASLISLMLLVVSWLKKEKSKKKNKGEENNPTKCQLSIFFFLLVHSVSLSSSFPLLLLSYPFLKTVFYLP